MVTKSIAMCRFEMKRCRFGVQNGAHADDPGGDAEVMDKGEVRYPSLDLIWLGGVTGHTARAPR